MKKGRGININIHFTNRWLYTFVAILILAGIGVGVYAVTYASSGAGHPITEISNCGSNQTLRMNSAGTTWTCANREVCMGNDCKTRWVNLYNVTATGCGGGSNSIMSLSSTCRTAVCKTTQGGCIYYLNGICLTYAYSYTYYTCAGACSASSATTCNNVIMGAFVA